MNASELSQRLGVTISTVTKLARELQVGRQAGKKKIWSFGLKDSAKIERTLKASSRYFQTTANRRESQTAIYASATVLRPEVEIDCPYPGCGWHDERRLLNAHRRKAHSR